MRNILITGGQGYIGGRLAEFLAKNGRYNVVVTSRNPNNLSDAAIKNIKVNTKTDKLSTILEGYHTVIHLAALDAQSCVSRPIEAIDVNISDTLRWRAAADSEFVKQFIYFSTIHVYDNSNDDFINEQSNAFPSHSYAITHKCAEDYVLSPLYSKHSKAIVFRLSNAFGYPAGSISQWHLVMLDFCKQAMETNKIVIKSNSSQLRDFISLADVCRGVQFSMDNDIDAGIYNLSSGVNRTLLEVANAIKMIAFERYNQTIDVVEKAERAEIKQSLISNKKLEQAGFLPSNDLESELGNLIEYCRQTFKTTW
jgi:UDP-glucose 4-epimerase